VQKLIS